MHKKIRYFQLLAIGVCAFITLLFANFSYAEELPKSQISDAPFLVPNYGYTIGFVRVPGTPKDHATLRIMQPVGVNGCLSITNPEPKTEILGPTVKITLSAPIIKIDDSPQYGNNTCRKNSPYVISDATLNRDELMINNVNKITLNGPGGSDTYDLYVDTDKIYLFKKISEPISGIDIRTDYFDDKYFFKPEKSIHRNAPLTHWFYPDNVVILSAPAASDDQDVTEQIKNLALSKGLTELKILIKDFEPPTTDKNTLYFVDHSGIIAKSLNQDLGAIFGTVTTTEIFQGPEGQYERPKELEVIARLPGISE